MSTLDLLAEFVLVPNYEASPWKVMRSQQPQIRDDKEFHDHMGKHGIKFTREPMSDPHSLMPSQHNFKLNNIHDLAAKLKTSKKMSDVKVSSDGVVIDGHHRWLAGVLDPECAKYVNLQRADAPFSKIKPLLHKYVDKDALNKLPEFDGSKPFSVMENNNHKAKPYVFDWAAAMAAPSLDKPLEAPKADSAYMKAYKKMFDIEFDFAAESVEPEFLKHLNLS